MVPEKEIWLREYNFKCRNDLYIFIIWGKWLVNNWWSAVLEKVGVSSNCSSTSQVFVLASFSLLVSGLTPSFFILHVLPVALNIIYNLMIHKFISVDLTFPPFIKLMDIIIYARLPRDRLIHISQIAKFKTEILFPFSTTHSTYTSSQPSLSQ